MLQFAIGQVPSSLARMMTVTTREWFACVALVASFDGTSTNARRDRALGAIVCPSQSAASAQDFVHIYIACLMPKARLFALTPASPAIGHKTLLLAFTVVSRLDARARVAQLRIKQRFESCAVAPWSGLMIGCRARHCEQRPAPTRTISSGACTLVRCAGKAYSLMSADTGGALGMNPVVRARACVCTMCGCCTVARNRVAPEFSANAAARQRLRIRSLTRCDTCFPSAVHVPMLQGCMLQPPQAQSSEICAQKPETTPATSTSKRIT